MSTIVVTSTNFITSTVTADNSDTATVTSHVTVTTYAKRSIGPFPIATAAKFESQRRGFARQDAPATGIAKRSTILTTVTEVETESSDSTVSVTEVVVRRTSEIETVDVVVTSTVYPSAGNTVTVYSTATMTSTSPSVGVTTGTSTAAPSPTESSRIATTEAPATSTSTTAVAADASDLSSAAIAGIGAGVGGFFLLVAIILAIVVLRKRRRSGVYPLVMDPSGIPQQHLQGASSAHHKHITLPLRQLTLPDLGAVAGTVRGQSPVHNGVREMLRSRQPQYHSDTSTTNRVSELPVARQQSGQEIHGHPLGHARVNTGPGEQRAEMESGPSRARRRVAATPTPAPVHTPRPMRSNLTLPNTAGRPAQGREFPLYTRR